MRTTGVSVKPAKYREATLLHTGTCLTHTFTWKWCTFTTAPAFHAPSPSLLLCSCPFKFKGNRVGVGKMKGERVRERDWEKSLQNLTGPAEPGGSDPVCFTSFWERILLPPQTAQSRRNQNVFREQTHRKQPLNPPRMSDEDVRRRHYLSCTASLQDQLSVSWGRGHGPQLLREVSKNPGCLCLNLHQPRSQPSPLWRAHWWLLGHRHLPGICHLEPCSAVAHWPSYKQKGPNGALVKITNIFQRELILLLQGS